MKFVVLATLLTITFTVQAQMPDPQYPIVPGFGGIYAIPEAQKYPDTTLSYQVVVDVTQGVEKPDQLNPSLNNIARMLNLHGISGIKKEQLEVVAVIHASATPVVLADEAYQQAFGCNNPNNELIRALSEAGVSLFVCGQSLLARNYYDYPLHPDITISISALTVLTEYQRKGYALLKF